MRISAIFLAFLGFLCLGSISGQFARRPGRSYATRDNAEALEENSIEAEKALGDQNSFDSDADSHEAISALADRYRNSLISSLGDAEINHQTTGLGASEAEAEEYHSDARSPADSGFQVAQPWGPWGGPYWGGPYWGGPWWGGWGWRRPPWRRWWW